MHGHNSWNAQSRNNVVNLFATIGSKVKFTGQFPSMFDLSTIWALVSREYCKCTLFSPSSLKPLCSTQHKTETHYCHSEISGKLGSGAHYSFPNNYKLTNDYNYKSALALVLCESCRLVHISFEYNWHVFIVHLKIHTYKKHHQIGVKMHSHKIGAKRLILIVVSFISTRKVDGVKWSTIYDTPKDKKADKRLDGGEEAIKIYLLFFHSFQFSTLQSQDT